MTNSISYSGEHLHGLYHVIFDELSEMVTITDLHGTVLYVNNAVSELLKQDKETLVGMSVFDAFGDAEFFGSTQDEVIEQSMSKGGFQGEIMVHDAEQNPIPLALRTKILTDDAGNPKYILGISKSLAGQRQVEDALQKVEMKYQQYVKNAPLGVFIVDKQANYVEVNTAASEITGYSQEELLRMNVNDFRIQEEGEEEDENSSFQTLINEGYATDVKKFRRKDGSQGWWSINSVRISEDRYMALTVDVTNMKRLEQELSDSESKLNRAQKVARIGSWSIDLKTKTVRATKQAHALYGLPERELALEEIQDIPLPEYREALDQAFNDLITKNKLYDVEFKIQRVTDQKIFDVHSLAEYDRERKIIFGTIQDITDRKESETKREELQRQVQHMQKLESLGLMAGGIAHDFNNLLMAIMGNIELSMAQISTDSSAHQTLQNAMSASKRASDLTLQMLSYAGRAQIHITQMDLNDLIHDNVRIFGISRGKHVNLVLDLDDSIPPLAADVSQVQQVVMNLLTNAVEALDEKPGTVRVETCRDRLTKPDLQRNILENNPAPGDYISLQVTDDGIGMDQNTRERLFDPFFTTKFTGRGLGMSAVKGIVEGHSGAIFIDSTPGDGTTIQVLFPMKETAASINSGSEESSGSQADTHFLEDITGEILLVDDEDMVREVCRSMLERYGLDVIEARDGESAVEILREKSSDIAGVIVDYSMPGMDGVETFRQMLEIEPNMKIILSSGYTEDAEFGELRRQGLAGFLHKPYEYDRLRNTLTRLLAAD